jgi:glycosyltransferase involved in cell wall biosynthesis
MLSKNRTDLQCGGDVPQELTRRRRDNQEDKGGTPRPLPTNKLRLTVLTSLFPPAVGGASELFRILTESWEKEASIEQVVVLTERGRMDIPKLESKGKILIRRILPASNRNERRRGLSYIKNRLWTYLLLMIVTMRHLRENGSQLMLVHGRYGRKSFLKAVKLLGARIVVLISDHLTRPEKFVDCDAVICITESVHERARKQLSGACQIHYVPLPLEIIADRARQYPAVDTRSPYFLFVGEVSSAKGVDVLLPAFATFRNDHPEFRLLLAGPVCDPSLVHRSGPGVSFLGEVGHEAAIGLIERAQAVVLPSRSEGLPRVCLEALLLGSTVICPPGVPELLRACPDWVLPAVTMQDVLDKLRQAVSKPFQFSYDLQVHNPLVVGRRIMEICAGVLDEGSRQSADKPHSRWAAQTR